MTRRGWWSLALTLIGLVNVIAAACVASGITESVVPWWLCAVVGAGCLANALPRGAWRFPFRGLPP